MTWFLNSLYLAILICGSPWMLWRYWKGKNKRGWSQKLLGNIQPNFARTVATTDNCQPATGNPDSQPEPAKRIWFHAVSVGEVNLLGPVIKEFRKLQPNVEIAISTTTETGFDLASSKYACRNGDSSDDCFVFFCPFDFSWAIKRVLSRLKPDALVLVELEMWPNLISVTRSQDIPVVAINARLSEKSARGYQRIRWLLGSVFRKLSLVLCQNESYKRRFIEVGCDPGKVNVSGNVKFDGVQTNRLNPATEKLVKLSGIHPSDKIFVAGSTQVEEDLLVAKAYQSIVDRHPELRLILVPRHPTRVGALVNELGKLGLRTQLRSKISLDPNVATTPDSPTSNRWNRGEVLIVDVIGELGAWWGLADAAYVGGSMGSRGGQNMIEPAGYGVPLSLGPNTWNFQEIVEQLKECRACREVQSLDEVIEFLDWALYKTEEAAAMGQRAQKVVLGHLGASQRTAETLCQVIASRDQVGPVSPADATHQKAA